MDDPEAAPHWNLYRFREIPVGQFLSQIDFFVYFTNERWRESFGRVIAEAVAAGKLVLTDPDTASTFGKGVIGTTPQAASAHIADYIAKPLRYQRDVTDAQAGLARFSASAFRRAATDTLRHAQVAA